ncbi:aminoglycoside phosphotransferase family protein [Inconstantimicrobium mannanitabidum]|uniref:Aminoglycoside phosphotransferase n=1 Tax=Inconstantimicrobium mannanitabidum TaxID=1604901 RepID=A0ACB5RC71_9CLOT|nr:phosphotransferase [Clostridium sp. TW13]GKX66392.1 aminoglycoside phosphotransferase [Clostridium sp. TW13]
MYSELKDIPSFESWRIIKKVNEGWSTDSKFYIEDYDGNRLLLRISDAASYDNKLKEFEFIKKCNSLAISMSQAIQFGFCNNKNNVYILLTWVEGDCLKTVLSGYTESEQYKLGLQAGRILKSIHSLKVHPTENIIAYDKKDKMLDKLRRYENSINRVSEDQFAIDFVKNNIGKINSLAPVYKHGDYHIGNLILTPCGMVGVIDFNRWEYGDRYEEFYKIQSFDVEVSIPFSIGQIHGYFDGEPSLEFWNILAVYVAYTSLNSIVWAEKFGEDEIDGMKKRCITAFNDYYNFKTVIPNWYKVNSDKYISIK